MKCGLIIFHFHFPTEFRIFLDRLANLYYCVFGTYVIK